MNIKDTNNMVGTTGRVSIIDYRLPMHYRLPISNAAAATNGKWQMANVWSMVNGQWSMASEGGK